MEFFLNSTKYIIIILPRMRYNYVDPQLITGGPA